MMRTDHEKLNVHIALVRNMTYKQSGRDEIQGYLWQHEVGSYNKGNGNKFVTIFWPCKQIERSRTDLKIKEATGVT